MQAQEDGDDEREHHNTLTEVCLCTTSELRARPLPWPPATRHTSYLQIASRNHAEMLNSALRLLPLRKRAPWQLFGRGSSSSGVPRAGCVRAARADTSDAAVSVRVTVAGEQVSAHVAVGLRTWWIIAVRKVPCHRLHTASGIELVSGVNDCAPAQPRARTTHLGWSALLNWAGLSLLAAAVIALRDHVPTSTRASPH